MFHVACLMISHKDHLIMNYVSWGLPDNVLCFMRPVWLWTMSHEAKMRIKLFLMRPTWWWTMSNGAQLMMDLVSISPPDDWLCLIWPTWLAIVHIACLIMGHVSFLIMNHVSWCLLDDVPYFMKPAWLWTMSNEAHQMMSCLMRLT